MAGMNIDASPLNQIETQSKNIASNMADANRSFSSMIGGSATGSMTNISSTPSMSGTELSTVLNGGESAKTDVMSRQLDAVQQTNELLKRLIENNDKTNKLIPTKSEGGNVIAPNRTMKSVTDIALAAERGDVSAVYSGSTNLGTGIMQGMFQKLGLSKMGMIAGGVGIAALAIGKGLDEMAKQYEKNLEGSEDFSRAFGVNLSRKNTKAAGTRNATISQNMFNQINGLTYQGGVSEDYIYGTGLTNADFLKTSARLGSYGITDFKQAARTTQLAAFMQNVTGADINSVQGLMGTAYRYGGESARDVAKSIYAGAELSGLTTAQTPEFLDAISRVMEDGISKGFTRSTKDIAENLSFLSELSGKNSQWTGEKGAEKYLQIANGIAGATALSNTTQVLTYKAYRDAAKQMSAGDLSSRLNGAFLEGQDELNTFALMEQDQSLGMMVNVNKALKNAYNGDTMAVVESWKNQSGLSYTGSMELYKLLEEAETKGMDDKTFQAKYDKIQSDPNNMSDTKNMTNALNQLNATLANAGKTVYEAKISGLDKIAHDVAGIFGWMTRDPLKKQTESALEGFFVTQNNYETQSKNKSKQQILSMLENPETVGQAKDILETLNSFSDEEKSYANAHNIMQSIDLSSPDAARLLYSKVHGKASAYNDVIGLSAQAYNFTPGELLDDVSFGSFTDKQKKDIAAYGKQYASQLKSAGSGFGGNPDTVLQRALDYLQQIVKNQEKPVTINVRQ